MELLTFTFITAFILQDFGTLQVDPIDALPPTEQLRVFKDYYAYKLINVAVERLRKNEDIMEGGSECVRLIKTHDTSPVDAILTIMSIANDYYEQFVAVGQSDISPTEIDAGLMKNIRDVLFVIQRSVGKFPQVHVDDYLDALKAYTLQHKQHQYDDSVESAKKCFRSIFSINYQDNEAFFDQLSIGIKIVGKILQCDDEKYAKDRPQLLNRLNKITDELAKLSLETPDSEDFHSELATFVTWLND